MRTKDEQNGGKLSKQPVAKIEWGNLNAAPPSYISFKAEDFRVLAKCVEECREIHEDLAVIPGQTCESLAELRDRCEKAAVIVEMLR